MVVPFTKAEYPWIDTAEAVYHAKLLVLGRIPYVEIFSHHFFGYLAPFIVLERLSGLNPLGLWGLSIAFNFANAILVFLILKEISSKSCAYGGALLTVTAGWFPDWQGYFFNIQSVSLPLLYLFILVVIKTLSRPSPSNFVFAGLIYGLMFITDQRNATFGLVSLPILFDGLRPQLRRCSLFAASFLVFPIAALIYLWINGALLDFFYQTFVFPWISRNKGVSAYSESPYYLLTQIASYHLPEISLALFGTTVLIRSHVGRNIRLVVLYLTLGGLLASIAGGRAFSNYLLYLVPAIVLLASFVSEYRPPFRYGSHLGLITTIGYCLFVWFRIPGSACYLAGSFRVDSQIHAVGQRAAKYVQARTQPNSSVLVWGYYPQLYLFSERYSRWKVLEQLPLTGSNFRSTKFSQQGIVPSITREFKMCLEQYPPEIILDYRTRVGAAFHRCSRGGASHPNLDFLKVRYLAYFRNFVRDNYRLTRIYSGLCESIKVYRLRRDSPLRPRGGNIERACRSH